MEDTQLSKRLENLLTELDGKDATLGELMEHIGDSGFGMLLLLLAFPAALPIPAPGYATPFGLMMIYLGWQIVKGYQEPHLPERMKKKVIKYSLLKFTVKNGRLPLRAVEFFIRPRLTNVAKSRPLHVGLGITIILLAAMMSIPLPLTNTAPSFVIFMLAAGLLEEDGLFLIAGLLLAPVAASIAFAAIYFGITMGPEAVVEFKNNQAKPFIKGLFGI